MLFADELTACIGETMSSLPTDVEQLQSIVWAKIQRIQQLNVDNQHLLRRFDPLYANTSAIAQLASV